MQDLRSTVTKEAIAMLVSLANKYPDDFQPYTSKYFARDSGLLKLLSNGKRLISDMAHEGIIEILQEVCIPKIFELLAIYFKSKANLVRLRVGEYYQICLCAYPPEMLVKNQTSIENEFLLAGLEDQSQEVRRQVRVCFKQYVTLPEFSARGR